MEDPCEKDQFYGCDCQRYLAVGLLMPVLVLLSVFGGAAMLIVLPGRYFFCMRKSILQYFTEISSCILSVEKVGTQSIFALILKVYIQGKIILWVSHFKNRVWDFCRYFVNRDLDFAVLNQLGKLRVVRKVRRNVELIM